MSYAKCKLMNRIMKMSYAMCKLMTRIMKMSYAMCKLMKVWKLVTRKTLFFEPLLHRTVPRYQHGVAAGGDQAAKGL